jgi:CheY-like chemotaxis protein
MSKKPKILCVDDLPENLRIRAILLELFGCEVVKACDHPSALRAFEDGGIDLLLIDYHLANGATGEEIARDIRVLDPNVPLVMLTGDAKLPGSATSCVDAVLIKGASNPADLLATIQKLLPHATIRQRRDPPAFIPPKAG